MHGAQLLQVDGNFDDCLELARKTAADYPVTRWSTPSTRTGSRARRRRRLRDLRRAGPRPRHALPAGRQRRQHHRLLEGLPRVLRRRRRSTRRPGCSASRPPAPRRSCSATRCGNPDTIATAIRIGAPASWTAAIDARDDVAAGSSTRSPTRQILAAYRLLARTEAVFVEPASAASVAGLLQLSAAGELAAGASSRRSRRSPNAAGAQGMVGGQALDLEAAPNPVRRRSARDGLREMHARKTGALLRASAVAGAVMAGAPAEVLRRRGPPTAPTSGWRSNRRRHPRTSKGRRRSRQDRRQGRRRRQADVSRAVRTRRIAAAGRRQHRSRARGAGAGAAGRAASGDRAMGRGAHA